MNKARTYRNQKSLRRKTIVSDSRANEQTVHTGEGNFPRHGR